MNRKDFIKTLSILPLGFMASPVSEFFAQQKASSPTARMPVLFLGHGSPMNAIEDNVFVQGFKKIGAQLPIPKVILCISAHWETKGTWVTAMEHPRTIHDFGGFPKALFEVQYPAPGSPEWAKAIAQEIHSASVGMDEQWGLDHGAWSVIKHLYPHANIPVVQMSIDYTQPPAYHYALAKELSSLRNKGVMIVGSGNMVHNLGMVAWDKLNTPGFGYDWAIEASSKMKEFLRDGNHQALVDFKKQGKVFDLSIPTPEHFLPLIYSIALKDPNEEMLLFNDQALAGSLTMTSVAFGLES
jgi:4,5-DOPA dioxygenase extradiol